MIELSLVDRMHPLSLSLHKESGRQQFKIECLLYGTLSETHAVYFQIIIMVLISQCSRFIN